MQAADVDGDGMIDYAEFLAATVQLSTLETDENLQKVHHPMGGACVPDTGYFSFEFKV